MEKDPPTSYTSGQNQITFNSRYCKDHACFITPQKELDLLDKVYTFRISSIALDAQLRLIRQTSMTITLPVITIKSQWSITIEFKDFDDVLSNESADILP